MSEQHKVVNHEWDFVFEEGLKGPFTKGIRDGSIKEPAKWLFRAVPREIISFIDVIEESFLEEMKEESVDKKNLYPLGSQVSISIIQVYPEILQYKVVSVDEDDNVQVLILKSLQAYWIERLIEVGVKEGVFMKESDTIDITSTSKNDGSP